MDLHPYDNQERRFRHTDQETSAGVELVARLLGLKELPPIEGVLYEMSFFSGGIGVIDTVAITLPIDATRTASIVENLHAKRVQDAVADRAWGDDILWLISDNYGTNTSAPEEEARQFIEEHREDFQPPCHSADAIWFVHDSDVNNWTVLWRSGELLSYLSSTQG